jgi:hypothetical protein
MKPFGLGVSVYVGGAESVVDVELSHFVMAADRRSVQNASVPCWLHIKSPCDPCDRNTVGTQFIQNVCSTVTVIRDIGSSGILRSAYW